MQKYGFDIFFKFYISFQDITNSFPKNWNETLFSISTRVQRHWIVKSREPISEISAKANQPTAFQTLPNIELQQVLVENPSVTESSVFQHVAGLKLSISTELDVGVIRRLLLLLFGLLLWRLQLGLLVMVGEPRCRSGWAMRAWPTRAWTGHLCEHVRELLPDVPHAWHQNHKEYNKNSTWELENSKSAVWEFEVLVGLGGLSQKIIPLGDNTPQNHSCGRWLLVFGNITNKIRKRTDSIIAVTKEYSRVSYPPRNVSALPTGSGSSKNTHTRVE